MDQNNDEKPPRGLEKEVSFNFFLEKFPELELPVTLSDQEHHVFSRKNEPLNKLTIEKFLLPVENESEMDEFTEFIPGFQLKGTAEFGFHAVVYWKAELLRYKYILATFSKNGELIDFKEIAGTRTQDNQTIQSVATIEEDWMIYIVEGGHSDKNALYQASASHAHQMELLSDGRIIHA